MIYAHICMLFVGGMISGIAAYRAVHEKNPPARLPYLWATGVMWAGIAAIGILT